MPNARDLGFLLMKHPDRVHRFELPWGEAALFYPVAETERCTAQLVVQLDPIRLTRREGESPLEPYVNDRPYVANSFLATAMRTVFTTAMSGVSRDRAELAQTAIPLEFEIPAVRIYDAGQPKRWFEPLGYEVETVPIPLDETVPAWGDSRIVTLRLRTVKRLAEALNQLYVLIPAFDARKHYFVGEDELEKLLRKGAGWLDSHPKRREIVRGYLWSGRLRKSAMERLSPERDAEAEAEISAPAEPRMSLHLKRLRAAYEAIVASGASSVADLGCGEGKLLRFLIGNRRFNRILGMDVSSFALAKAERYLRLSQASPEQRERITLIHGSLAYRDSRLRGFEAAAVVEVIEHLDPWRLDAFAANLFGYAAPGFVVITTPNADYNAMYPDMPGMRHDDHRFEWSRAEFAAWCQAVSDRYGYRFEIAPVGDEHAEFGAPSQMATFRRSG